MTEEKVEIYIDACSKGNPGPASFAAIAHLIDGTIKMESGKLGIMTNQEAEFSAMGKALDMAHLYGWKKIVVYTDSRLVAQSSIGKWQLKSPRLLKMFNNVLVPAAQKIKGVPGGSIVVVWVPRETQGIVEADKLANEVFNPRLI